MYAVTPVFKTSAANIIYGSIFHVYAPLAAGEVFRLQERVSFVSKSRSVACVIRLTTGEALPSECRFVPRNVFPRHFCCQNGPKAFELCEITV